MNNTGNNPKKVQQMALVKALVLNVLLVIILIVSGIVAQSNALLANGLDNLSDAAVYGLSYFALFKGLKWQIRAARVSGVMLIVLGKFSAFRKAGIRSSDENTTENGLIKPPMRNNTKLSEVRSHYVRPKCPLKFLFTETKYYERRNCK